MISPRSRRRAITALFGGVGASATGFIVVVAMSPLLAEDFLGHPRWSGVPSALAIVGTAAGTSWLASIMERRGRRAGLLIGYLTAALSALVASVAAANEWFFLFAAAVFCLGLGYGASRLSRYAAADLYGAERGGTAIGWVVWAGTIGSVLGPLLLEPSQHGASSLGVPERAGPFLVSFLSFATAWLVLRSLYPRDHGAGFPASSRPRPDRGTGPRPRLATRARTALLALVVGQVVMILIMTITPVHIRGEGGGLDSVGVVIAAHTFGMYALSPVSGLLSDRLGRLPMIVAAGAALSGAGFLGASAGESTSVLAVALFLLGLGWNFGFVSASALLTESVPAEARVRLQGIADSVVWTSAAAAGALSGVLQAAIGYAALSQLAALVALVPATVIALSHRSPEDATPATVETA